MRLSFPASSLTPSVYLPHSSQTDFKTKIKSCCSPVQNPLLASCLPFNKTQSYIMVYKVLHNLHFPAYFIRSPLCLLHFDSPNTCLPLSICTCYLLCLECFLFHRPFLEYSCTSCTCLFECYLIKEAFQNHLYHTHTPLSTPFILFFFIAFITMWHICFLLHCFSPPTVSASYLFCSLLCWVVPGTIAVE